MPLPVALRWPCQQWKTATEGSPEGEHAKVTGLKHLYYRDCRSRERRGVQSITAASAARVLKNCSAHGHGECRRRLPLARRRLHRRWH